MQQSFLISSFVQCSQNEFETNDHDRHLHDILHCSLDLVRLPFTAFAGPTSHFLHRRLISPSNWYHFLTPPGGRTSWSDLSKTFSILCITAVFNPFIWRFSMKGFVSWLERFHENLKVFVFFISSEFLRHQTVLLLTLTISRM